MATLAKEDSQLLISHALRKVVTNILHSTTLSYNYFIKMTDLGVSITSDSKTSIRRLRNELRCFLWRNASVFGVKTLLTFGNKTVVVIRRNGKDCLALKLQKLSPLLWLQYKFFYFYIHSLCCFISRWLPVSLKIPWICPSSLCPFRIHDLYNAFHCIPWSKLKQKSIPDTLTLIPWGPMALQVSALWQEIRCKS